ncbi:MAG: hypothetical protein U0802_04270 [Candidatus Binatia bacterium]
MLAVPALTKELLYEADCLQAAWDLVKAWSWEERVRLWHDAHRPEALQARVRRIGSTRSRASWWRSPSRGCAAGASSTPPAATESITSSASRARWRAGAVPRARIIRRWIGDWRGDIQRLIAGSSYRIAA